MNTLYYVGRTQVEAIERGPFRYYADAKEFLVKRPGMNLYYINVYASDLTEAS